MIHWQSADMLPPTDKMLWKIPDNLTDLRFALRWHLSRYPWLYFPLLRLVRPARRHLHVCRDTEIAIEGYPRSANTFAVAAFLQAQKRPVKIARHLHLPVQVIRAVRWGISTLVLIRRPEEAVLSRLVRKPLLSAKGALSEYIAFYFAIRPYSDGYVLATSDRVTSDCGQVIDRIDMKFKADFLRFEHTPENVQRLFEMVGQMGRADTGKERVTETTIARP